jgi:organic hydroperoxide reductase OsmC/OhrA
MSEHHASIHWERGDQVFTDKRYSREHRWRFDGGIEVVASASPGRVPLPMSRADAIDPEEAFVASLSSCHMLWFLFIAARQGYRVDSYLDDAVGVMGQDAQARWFVATVTLRPQVVFGGANHPSPAQLAGMHEQAHGECFIANSVKTTVLCEPRA